VHCQQIRLCHNADLKLNRDDKQNESGERHQIRCHHPDPLQHRCDDSGRYRGDDAGTGEPFRRTQPSADATEAG
jgi:hypothetical protein